ncbi:uncharacterized protein LOC113205196 [Frankliniella occidentalis]|uniref:Uncharacterized protein LOC113205196 n=1 Tax=Frankliniella occidentalis TaxID=133901 RepID=A0A6J1S640_FRAOC|nr:uncharacterized protein LOC113205196 [Frankliniella occidentalis]
MSYIEGVERTKAVHYDDPVELVDVIKATPPWDTVILIIEDYRPLVAFTDEASCSSPSKLFMKVPTTQHSVKIWTEVAREAKHLSINEDTRDFWQRRVDQEEGREKGLDQILACLLEARSLESLALYVWEFTTEFTWPQEVVLPHLTKVSLVRTAAVQRRCQSKRQPDLPPPPPSSSRVTSAAVFESLLRAHSGQLADVTVEVEQLPLLIGALPQDIPKLSVTHKSPVAYKWCQAVATLSVTNGNELEIRFVAYAAQFAELVARAVLSWTCPRRSLTLHNVPSPEAMSVLLGCETHSLVLDPAPSLQMLRDLPADAIPALSLLTLVCHRCSGDKDKTPHCSSEQRVAVCREAILADLVLRAPRSLHVVSRCAKGEGSDFIFAPYLLGRHGESEVESCTVCAEAQIPNSSIPYHLYPLPYVRVEQDEAGHAVVDCAECLVIDRRTFCTRALTIF